MIYNIDFDICALFISGFSVFFVLYKKKLRKYQNKVFFFILVSVFLTVIFDITSSVANSYPDRYSDVLKDFLNYNFLIIHNLFPISFAWYTLTVFGLHHHVSGKKMVLYSVPFLGNLLLFALNPFTHCFFYYDQYGIYTHGSLFPYLYACAFAYLLTTAAFIVKYGRSISRFKCYALLLFLFSGLVAVLIEMLHPALLLELYFESISLLGIMLTIENEDELLNGITGVYNRKAFQTDSRILLKNHVSSTLLVVKLSNLNYYSAMLGIDATNNLLRSIVQWLTGNLRDCTVYDCDNGHFSMILFDRTLLKPYTEQIMGHFQNALLLGQISVRMNIQLCVINIPEDTSDPNHILLMVDTPISSDLTDSQIIYSHQFSSYQREIKILHTLRNALREHKLLVYYQPIWSSSQNAILSAEALSRLYDEDLGFIPPDEFIALAEKNGLIIQLGEYVFDEVCRFYRDNKLDTLGISYIEVNLSAIQCMSKSIADTLTAITHKYDLPPARINLEITESAFMGDSAILTDTMNRMTAAGFTFSMDDYGTGYSNFSYLFYMPFRIIKLDKSLLWSADKNPRAATILKNTLQMIRELKFESLVEGVETKGQRDMLEALGCDFQQGYYYTKPVDGTAFCTYCRDFIKEQKTAGGQ